MRKGTRMSYQYNMTFAYGQALWHCLYYEMYPELSRNSKANASEFLGNHEEMFYDTKF